MHRLALFCSALAKGRDKMVLALGLEPAPPKIESDAFRFILICVAAYFYFTRLITEYI
jgi:hypothetical protein